MKQITVVNPDRRLRSLMQDAHGEWVQTCHSATCGHMSHDSGYTQLSGLVPVEVETALVGASVHSHGVTIRSDDARGQAELRQWQEKAP